MKLFLAIRLLGIDRFTRIVVCFFCLVSTALSDSLSATCDGETKPLDWQVQGLLDHPLIGKIQTSDGNYISPKQLLQRAASADIVLLGEQHDHPDHHRLQLWLLSRLSSCAGVRALVMEMLDTGQQIGLDSLKPSDGQDRVKSKLKWNDKRWRWDFYGPLIQYAVQSQIPIRAANFTPAELKQIMTGEHALPQEPPQALRAALSGYIHRAHCDALPAEHLPGMVSVQFARDRLLAQRSAQTDRAAPVIVIAGNFHTRKDLGAAWHLSQIAPRLDVLSISLTQVREDGRGSADYWPANSDSPHDILWWTPALPDKDYCAPLRKKTRVDNSAS